MIEHKKMGVVYSRSELPLEAKMRLHLVHESSRCPADAEALLCGIVGFSGAYKSLHW